MCVHNLTMWRPINKVSKKAFVVFCFFLYIHFDGHVKSNMDDEGIKKNKTCFVNVANMSLCNLGERQKKVQEAPGGVRLPGGVVGWGLVVGAPAKRTQGSKKEKRQNNNKQRKAAKDVYAQL